MIFVMEMMVGHFVRGSLCISEHAPATTPQAFNSQAYLLKNFILASQFTMHLESEVSHILPSPIVSMLKKSSFTAYL